MKAICPSRESLIKTRTQLVNRVRSYVRSRIRTPLRATPDSLPGKVRRALLEDAEGLLVHVEERLLVVLQVISARLSRPYGVTRPSWGHPLVKHLKSAARA